MVIIFYCAKYLKYVLINIIHFNKDKDKVNFNKLIYQKNNLQDNLLIYLAKNNINYITTDAILSLYDFKTRKIIKSEQNIVKYRALDIAEEKGVERKILELLDPEI